MRASVEQQGSFWILSYESAQFPPVHPFKTCIWRALFPPVKTDDDTAHLCRGSHFDLNLFVLSDKSFLGNSQRLSAPRRCFCFQETRRREEEKSLCLSSACVYMCASQDTEGMWDRGSPVCHFDQSLDPFSHCFHIFQRGFFYFFIFCMMFVQTPSYPSTKGSSTAPTPCLHTKALGIFTLCWEDVKLQRTSVSFVSGCSLLE